MSLEEANKKVHDAGNEYRMRKAEDKARQEQEDREERIRRQKDKEFIASFYKYAFLGIMLNWVDNDMKEDPKDIIERLSILVEGDIASAVERFSNR
jgi:adenylate kinase